MKIKNSDRHHFSIPPYLSWAEIDLRAIRYNFNQIKKRVGKRVKILAAVKANAYGHGMVEVSHALERCGVDYLGVAFLSEGVILRKARLKTPILIFSHSLPSQARDIVKYNLTASVSTLALARAISREAARSRKTAKVHIKVDTGMGRLGIREENLMSLAKALFRLPNIKVEGIFTHFPSADEEGKCFTKSQIANFKRIIIDLERCGYNISLHHTAGSAAIIKYPESFFNLIRPGLMLYGLYYSISMKKLIKLKPAFSLKTTIVLLKDVPRNIPISYGRTYITRSRTRIGILPIGYADGYSRSLSNIGEVLVHGVRRKVIGRICMDHTIVDVKDSKVKIGDEVTLIGRSGKEKIVVEDIAKKIGTIPHEIVSCIGPRIARVFK